MVPVTGYYEIGAQMSVLGGTNRTNPFIEILANGVPLQGFKSYTYTRNSDVLDGTMAISPRLSQTQLIAGTSLTIRLNYQGTGGITVTSIALETYINLKYKGAINIANTAATIFSKVCAKANLFADLVPPMLASTAVIQVPIFSPSKR